MQFHVTIPAIDLVDEPIVAQNAKKAVAKALAREHVFDSLDFDNPMEAIVTKPSGRKVIFDAVPVLSFRCTKVG
jgi:hypothetical protein